VPSASNTPTSDATESSTDDDNEEDDEGAMKTSRNSKPLCDSYLGEGCQGTV
jgi:hypothetical protein